ncbi:hypothetical protein O1L44_21430 [Streptomyces noursei]|nr:hypothetical protein [Streptomyces noursei]
MPGEVVADRRAGHGTGVDERTDARTMGGVDHELARGVRLFALHHRDRPAFGATRAGTSAAASRPAAPSCRWAVWPAGGHWASASAGSDQWPVAPPVPAAAAPCAYGSSAGAANGSSATPPSPASAAPAAWPASTARPTRRWR